MKKLKKLTMTLVALFAMTTGAWAGVVSHWPDFNGEDYDFQAAFVAAIKIDGEIITADDPRWDALEVAFFVGDECRGNGNYLYNGYVVEYGNPFPIIDGAAIYLNNGGEQVSFKMYDHINGILYEDCVVTLKGEPLTILTGEGHGEGYDDPNNPVFLSFTTPAAGPEVTWNAATKTGTFAMPGYDVELEVAYFNITAPTANTTDGDIHAGTTTPLINAGSTTEEGATIKYLVTATNEQPTSTDGFSATVPTAEAITAPGTYYVWYYLDFATGDDSDISAQAIQVTVADYLDYTISLAKGTEDAGKWNIEPKEAKPGTEITATYTGTKHVKSVRAVKKPEPKAAAEATAEDKDKLICTEGHIHAYGEDAWCTAARVAKIIYIGETGHATYTHGLALALTDEGDMTWGAAKTACNTTKNTSTPVTNATWLLASKEQWQKMGAIDDSQTYTDLRDGFSSVGGTDMVPNVYWSSTEKNNSDAWQYNFNNPYWLDHMKGDDRVSVRACLAF